MQPLRGLDMAENRSNTRRYAASRHDDGKTAVSTDTIRPIRGDTPMKEIQWYQPLPSFRGPIRADTPTIIREGSLDPVWPYRIFPFLGGDTPIRGRYFCEVLRPFEAATRPDGPATAQKGVFSTRRRPGSVREAPAGTYSLVVVRMSLAVEIAQATAVITTINNAQEAG